jgi:hypothetical protein
MSDIDFNALGQAIDTTFGRSSTTNAMQSQSIKMVLRGPEVLEVKFTTIVNLVSDREMVDLKKRFTDESSDLVEQALKRIKEKYKDATGNNIKLKQLSEKDGFEIINLNIYNRKRTAYYRRNLIFSVG